MQERSFQPRSSIRKKMILGLFAAFVWVWVGEGAGLEEAVGVAFSARIIEGSEKVAMARVRRGFLIMGVEGCETPSIQKSCTNGYKMCGKAIVSHPSSPCWKRHPWNHSQKNWCARQESNLLPRV